MAIPGANEYTMLLIGWAVGFLIVSTICQYLIYLVLQREEKAQEQLETRTVKIVRPTEKKSARVPVLSH